MFLTSISIEANETKYRKYQFIHCPMLILFSEEIVSNISIRRND